MKIGVYLCSCGDTITEKFNAEKINELTIKLPFDILFENVKYICSEDGKNFLRRHLKENKIERVVIAACSPRDHENTFMRLLDEEGVNPYLFQMVNIREQIAWVTNDIDQATEKIFRYIRAAIFRVMLHEPLKKKEIDINPNVLVIGAGPAGQRAALNLAQSGRKVTMIEKTPVIGGLPIRYEDAFPNLECSPCMLEPLEAEILHGEYAKNIEIFTQTEIIGITGFYGNFTTTLQQEPRYVDISKCIGCMDCIEPCPVEFDHEFNHGMNKQKSIDFAIFGGLPNVPYIDSKSCLRLNGGDCQICMQACPIEETIIFDDKEKIIDREVGAIVLATGSTLYDIKSLSSLYDPSIPNVYDGYEFERILASNGPTGGAILTKDGKSPEKIAIVHCVGSLDDKQMPYCSGICCEYAFKFNHMIEKKSPDTLIYHLYKELSVSGKEEYYLYQQAKNNHKSQMIRYNDFQDLKILQNDNDESLNIFYNENDSINADMVILCPAVIPSPGVKQLSELLEVKPDKFGFFEELHGRMDSAQSKLKGIYLAGACQSPMDIQKAINHGLAASSYILSGLIEGKKMEVSPVKAVVQEEKCSGCKVCLSLCPYKSITFDPVKNHSNVNEVLCQGCGACVAACPSSAIKGNHFTNEEILVEIEELLK
jgi:heterodisulfide reductase subunit A2